MTLTNLKEKPERKLTFLGLTLGGGGLGGGGRFFVLLGRGRDTDLGRPF